MLLGMSERGELFCHWPEEQPITNKEQEAGCMDSLQNLSLVGTRKTSDGKIDDEPPNFYQLYNGGNSLALSIPDKGTKIPQAVPLDQ